MRFLAHLRDVLNTFWVLAIPVTVFAAGLYPDPWSEPRPGESRAMHHIRTCPNCLPEAPVSCYGGCRELAAILEAMRGEGDRGGPCQLCSGSRNGKDRTVGSPPVGCAALTHPKGARNPGDPASQDEHL